MFLTSVDFIVASSMALYPSLEDMKVDQMLRAQEHMISSMSQPVPTANEAYPTVEFHARAMPRAATASMYPALGDYMGLELSDEMIAANMPEYMQVAVKGPGAVVPSVGGMVAPVSGMSAGLQRAHVNHGIRQVGYYRGFLG